MALTAHHAPPGCRTHSRPFVQVSFETLIAAYGMSGMADKAEAAFERMRAAGAAPHLLGLCPCCCKAPPALPQAPPAAGECRLRCLCWRRRLGALWLAPLHPPHSPCLPCSSPPPGFAPRDYAYCGLIAAHSFKGDWAAALRVRERMRAAGVTPTVHVSPGGWLGATAAAAGVTHAAAPPSFPPPSPP